MNRINPRKLLHSKWTAKTPLAKEKHFMVTEVEFDDDGMITSCQIEAILTRRSMLIDWRNLKDSDAWQQGWK